jgi:hypothetical protein
MDIIMEGGFCIFGYGVVDLAIFGTHKCERSMIRKFFSRLVQIKDAGDTGIDKIYQFPKQFVVDRITSNTSPGIEFFHLV